MPKYKVAQVGCGHRGGIHLDGWLNNPDRFQVVAVCDLDKEKAARAAESRKLDVTIYTDADRMLAETKPDIFCFSTLPNVRLSMVELAVKHQLKALVFEKPMATSLEEAFRITQLCRQNKILAVVSHQQKYLTSFEKFKAIIDGGGIGKLYRVDASCQPWLSQLGTHYIDYILWANGGVHAQWVVGHVHGRELLTNDHPSSNYTMGQIGFANGVRAFVEFGKLSASHMDKEHFWVDDRLTAYGTHGYVWCDTDGRWGAFNRETQGEMLSGEGENWQAQEKYRIQRLFAREVADCLDDKTRLHPCNIEITYHGYEIMEALCLSAMDHKRVDLPLDVNRAHNILERMRKELPDCPDLLVGRQE
jgi:predicted dehydrogenase